VLRSALGAGRSQSSRRFDRLNLLSSIQQLVQLAELRFPIVITHSSARLDVLLKSMETPVDLPSDVDQPGSLTSRDDHANRSESTWSRLPAPPQTDRAPPGDDAAASANIGPNAF